MTKTSVCKKCRRVGQKLFLKGERCFSQKCALVRKPYIPGLHGGSGIRKGTSEYGEQLIEKQKIRYSYGISEKQLKNYFKKIVRQKGNKEELLIGQLESRLDNVVFRLGWAASRALARQLVNHGHILVNRRKNDIPSYQVKKGDVIQLRERSKKLAPFRDLKTTLKKYQTPAWLSLDKQKLIGEVIDHPQAADLNKIGEISKVIEYYSR